MFYEDAIFPPDVGYLARGGDEWKTKIDEQDNGFETRYQRWSQARASWTISGALMTKETIGPLGFYNIKNFHNAMRGSLHGFRFKDFNDYKVSKNAGLLDKGFGTGKGVYQLGKAHKAGSALQIQNIYKPVNNTVKIYKNSILQTTGYTVDNTKGKVTFNPTLQYNFSIAIGSPICVVTTTSGNHTLQNGQTVTFSSTNPLVNGKTFLISNVTANTFSIVLNTSTTISGVVYLYPQPTDILTAEYEFDRPVRFDNDILNAGMDEAGFISIETIRLVELRVR